MARGHIKAAASPAVQRCLTQIPEGHDPLLLLLFLQGVDEGPDGLKLISDVIQEKLGITMSVLMGANIANEVADEKFCETTIG